MKISWDAISVTPGSRQWQIPFRRDNIASRLKAMYRQAGDISHLDGAIKIEQERDHPDLEDLLLYQVGELFIRRYSRTGAMADLDESIRRIERVESLQPRDAQPIEWRNALAAGYGQRYLVTRLRSDADESIRILRDIGQDTSRRQASKYEFGINPRLRNENLLSLADQLGNRSRRTGSIQDLDVAIEIEGQAINAHDEKKTSFEKQPVFSNHGMWLLERYRATKMRADLKKACRICQQAVDADWASPSRAFALCALGDVYRQKYAASGTTEDIMQAIQAFGPSLSQTNAPLQDRIKAGIRLLESHALISQWQKAFYAAKTTLALLHNMISRSLENPEKQHILAQFAGFASDAAAVALHAQKGPLVALDFLEQGRGLLATSLEDMRTDIAELRERCPDMAEQFVRLRDLLELSASRHVPKGSENDDKIVLRPDFLAAPSRADVQASANHGPIAIINVSPYRYDAFLVEEHEIRALTLPKLSKGEAQEKARVQGPRLGTPSTLEWLWDSIAEPVLDALGFTQPPMHSNNSNSWLHVCNFPLHATGYHRQTAVSTDTMMDRAMSSYSSSIKTIMHSRRRRFYTSSPEIQPQALFVAMQNTPECSPLPSAMDELSLLQGLFKSMAWNAQASGRKKQDVISHLSSCQVFHFASHGHTDRTNPGRSFLYLEDWKNDRFTVVDLLDLNFRQGSPFLAYLSACGTGQIREEEFVDESIHLISAFQLAGFRHVVGTLWEVNEDLCVDMAKITYETIMAEGVTDDSVCLGQHTATRRLRDNWRSGSSPRTKNRDEKAASKRGIHHPGDRQGRHVYPCEDEDDDEDEELHWVSFVHFGV
ncbi:CHAT domain-containing protein [Thelonectria olida]|uniref:CHAT domain-containing protein n=1 Tax=Thelonectria olida TaxID=1576542 RepID=A0A9P9AMG2_9HYPO|nr:CHAT domain-containing protein [Thelonectria olida]